MELDKRLLRRVWAWNPSRSLQDEVFANVPDKLKVNKFTEPGTRLLVAKYPDFYKIYLLRYHDAGEPYYPHTGVDVWIANEQFKTCFYIDSVSIHPSKETIKIRETRDENDNIVSVVVGEYIPITKRDERESRKLVIREKKMEKEEKKQARLDKKKAKDDAKEEKRMKKIQRMREIEERLKRKGSIKKELKEKLEKFEDKKKSLKKEKKSKKPKKVKRKKK